MVAYGLNFEGFGEFRVYIIVKWEVWKFFFGDFEENFVDFEE